MPYYVFAWVASVFYALEVISGKLASKYLINNPWFFNFTWNGLVLALTAIVAFTQGVALPTSWVNLFWAAFFWTMAGIFYILSLYKLDVSVLTPLFTIRDVIAVILGALFLNEVLGLEQYLLIALIFVLSFVVSLDERWTAKSFFNKNIGLSILNKVAAALMALFINKTVNEIGLWSASLWIALLSQIMLLPTILLFKNDLKHVTPKGIGAIFVLAVMGTIAGLALNKAYSENIGISSIIVSLPISLVLAFLFSVFKPDLLEKHPPKVYAVRFAAAAIMIFAALRLTSSV